MKPSDQAQWQGSVGSWLGQDSVGAFKGSAPDGWILCDTGALTRGWYDFTVLLSGDEQKRYAYIEHRNAANDDSIEAWILVWQPYNTQVIPIHSWFMDTNERLRIRNVNASDATICGNIHWVRRA